MKRKEEEIIFLEGDELRLGHPNLVKALGRVIKQIQEIESRQPQHQPESVVKASKPVSVLTLAKGWATGILGIN